MKPTAPLPDLDAETLAALRDFAKREGRTWKSILNNHWMKASLPGILHRLRNTHGPEWLAEYKLPKELPADGLSLPPGYDIHRSVFGDYRWRFEVNGSQPDGQRANMDKEEARQAAWMHWTSTNNALNHALPNPIGTT